MQIIRAEESGQPPDRDELLAKHPDLADELREFFANRDQMDQVPVVTLWLADFREVHHFNRARS